MEPQELSHRLAGFLQRFHRASAVEIDELRLLTGGASRQTWSFDATVHAADGAERKHMLVLRMDPRRSQMMERGTEWRLLQAAERSGVPVPHLHAPGDDSLGVPFFIMERLDGETVPRRLLRDEEYAQARRVMVDQLARALARIHSVPVHERGLRHLPAPNKGIAPAHYELDRHEQVYRALTPDPHPAFELAFRWLRAHAPVVDGRRLVHGDFRIGNVIFGPEGARAILDWELAHVGDPMEDIGWLCVRSWRFGNDDKPAGGLGTREDFYQAYEGAGGTKVDPKRVLFWEAFGNLRWGISCIVQVKTYLSGASPSLELASIGRRVAETEWELLRIIGQ
jgi:aminoglycoside phosphotransferase (APT) family kinase protein